ncbi:hypothetical protein H6F76_27740 [Leptolyngbya sp. FACHB-321]|uniref:hypothetical protein n=1 Tax=Leptolyngbya sp. FACHB-321 TaxID=2692807 RepID=UPI001683C11A|nr:hypothetical protein [Leptolyngbya sp. FACHB-321]MBD2038749.1 hypothetical protein [Leptolyngbya sp. FACHB-321]
MPARASQPNRQKSVITVAFSRFLWTRPFAVLGGAWVVMVVISLVAVSGLLSPESSDGKRTTEAAIVRTMAKTPQREQQSRLPLWLFGAIALSCAAGSMLVAKQAMRPSRPQVRSPKLKLKHLAPHPAPSALEETPSAPEPMELSIPTPSSPPAPAPAPSFVLEPRRNQTTKATPSVTLMQLAQMQLNQAQQTKAAPAAGQPTVALAKVAPVKVASVTVVPPEEKSPLDWGEARLADQLELRKQRSVSFSLRT